MEEFGGELIIGLLVVTLCIFIFIGGMLIALIHILVKKTNFFNEEFDRLPQNVKDELKAMCVLFTEQVGGVLVLEFARDGTLEFRVEAADNDYLFDEIESGLQIRRYQREKAELLQALETYYKYFVLPARLTKPGES